MNLTTPHGDYKKLHSFQKAEVIYDLTFFFCHQYLQKNDRTVDQMIQAARSGKQNIAEGSAAGVTSMETEIKLTNVAKASLQELLLDYEDFLRVRTLRQWEKDSPEVIFMRAKAREADLDRNWYLETAKSRPPETIANMAICLLHQADYLLQRQLESLERKFLQTGGFRERLTTARRMARNTGNAGNTWNTVSPRASSAPSAPSAPGGRK